MTLIETEGQEAGGTEAAEAAVPGLVELVVMSIELGCCEEDDEDEDVDKEEVEGKRCCCCKCCCRMYG